MAFPAQRLRRLRQNTGFRRLVRETSISADDLVLPLFVVPGHGIKKEMSSLPENYHLSIDCLVEEAKVVRDLGVSAILLFGVAVKDAVPDLLVITDVCLCEYTPHSHCGVLKDGYLMNDLSLELLAKTAVSHAEAGSDMVAPAAMLDGQIGTLRQGLDASGFENLPIMAYSAKYASKLYDPFFREGTQSALAHGDKRTHQMPVSNSNEAMREIALDIEEGADIIIVKPGLFCLDIVYRAKQQFQMPIAVYNVSGEYAMIDAAARLGRLDKNAILFEALASMKRAGADILITYAAKQAARCLR